MSNDNMIREILFRGKRVDNGEWVEGDFCKPCNIVFEEIGYDSVLGQYGVPVVADHTVIPGTVGQFTGLFDRKGNRIFEGDICRFFCEGSQSEYLVRWNQEKCAFVCCEESCEIPDELDTFFAENCEVVANIFDNAELLKGCEQCR